jgi:hypothetical protein
MKRKNTWLPIVGAIMLAASCANPLASNQPLDIILSLGLIGGANGKTHLNAAQGAEFSVPLTIAESQGRSLTGSYQVIFALSADTDPTTGTDYGLGTQTVAAGKEASITLSVPAAVPAGAYNLIAYSPVATADPGTRFASSATAYFNVSVRQIVVATAANALPDLSIEVQTGAATSFSAPGASIPAGFVIHNYGYLKVASGTAIVVRALGTMSMAPSEFAKQTLTLSADLLPQASVTGNFTITVPALAAMIADTGVPPAAFETWAKTLTVTVDSDAAVAEINEANNTDSLLISSGNKLADAYISEIVLPNGQSVFRRNSSGAGQVAVVVANGGRVGIDAYSVRLYLDANSSGLYDTGDYVVEDWDAASTPSVGPDQVTTLTGGTSAWPDVSGTFTLRAMIHDSSGEYPSRDSESEDNLNYGSAWTKSITLNSSLVNLKLTNLTSSQTSYLPPTGGTLPVTVAFANTGSDGLDTDFNVAFYLSADASTIPAGDTALGSPIAFTNPIAAGGRSSLSANLAIPAEAAGFYTLYCVLDSANAVSEMDEADNTPANASGPCAYVPMTNSTISANVLVYRPKLSEKSGNYYVYLYDYVTHTYQNGISTSTSNPGTAVGNFTYPFDVTVTYLIDVYGWSPADYAFRLVPNYVTAQTIVPDALKSEEGSEPNDAMSSAALLIGTHNPLFGWVIGRIGNQKLSSTDNDDNYYFHL